MIEKIGEQASRLFGSEAHRRGELAAESLGPSVFDMAEPNGTMAELADSWATIEERLSAPELLPAESNSMLQAELISFVEAGLTAHEQGHLSHEGLGWVSTSSLRFLAEITDQTPIGSEDFRVPGQFYGFHNAIPPLLTLFDRLDAIQPASLEKAAARLLVLSRFTSPEVDGLYEGFVNQYGEQLIMEDTLPPAVAHLWQAPHFLARMDARIRSNHERYKAPVAQWPTVERILLNKAFQAFGFSGAEREDLFSAWNSFESRLENKEKQRQMAGRFDRMLKAWEVMSTLMVSGPEVVHEIYSRFDIRNFGRYTAGTLYRQLEYFRQAEQNGGTASARPLVIVGVGDWNNALCAPETQFGCIDPVYMEAGSLDAAIEAITKTRRVAPINNLIISAHGDKECLNLSVGKGQEITSRLLLQSRALARLKREKGIFTTTAVIVLACCQSGKKGEDAIGEAIAEYTAMDVIAPTAKIHGYIESDPTDNDGYRVVFIRSREDFFVRRGYKNLGRACVTFRNGEVSRRSDSARLTA
jgi:hypothetical protein